MTLPNDLPELNGDEVFENWDQLVAQPNPQTQKSELEDGLMDDLMSEEKGQDYWVNLFQNENFSNMDLFEAPYTPYTLNETQFHHDFVQLRTDFLKELSQNYLNDLRSADLSEESIFYIGKGFLPANWTVHIKTPLLYGGKLKEDNLILIPEMPFHKLIHSFLNRQILSEAGIAHPKKLYVPTPVGKVYISGGDWSGSGGKATSDRSVMAGISASSLQQMSIKTGGR